MQMPEIIASLVAAGVGAVALGVNLFLKNEKVAMYNAIAVDVFTALDPIWKIRFPHLSSSLIYRQIRHAVSILTDGELTVEEERQAADHIFSLFDGKVLADATPNNDVPAEIAEQVQEIRKFAE